MGDTGTRAAWAAADPEVFKSDALLEFNSVAVPQIERIPALPGWARGVCSSNLCHACCCKIRDGGLGVQDGNPSHTGVTDVAEEALAALGPLSS